MPGCHATGFIAPVAPLVELGLVPKTALLHCTSLTGYSGGGKKMIAQYEAERTDPALDAPRPYGWHCTTSTCRRWQQLPA